MDLLSEIDEFSWNSPVDVDQSDDHTEYAEDFEDDIPCGFNNFMDRDDAISTYQKN
jgi:hypothetical protein